MIERIASPDVESIAMKEEIRVSGVRIYFTSLFARCGFMMQKHHFPVANNFISEITYTKTKIDIAKGYGERLIEPIDLVENLASRHQARCGDRTKASSDEVWLTAIDIDLPLVRIEIDLILHEVLGYSNADNDSRVLDNGPLGYNRVSVGSRWIKQDRAYRANVRASGFIPHALKPA